MKVFVLACVYLVVSQCAESQVERSDGIIPALNASVRNDIVSMDGSTFGRVGTGEVSLFMENEATAPLPMLQRYYGRSQKDPVLALVLSAVLPGAGQFYNDQYWMKGLIQTVVCGAGIAVALSLGWENKYGMQQQYDVLSGHYVSRNAYQGEQSTPWLAVGFGVAGAAWLWSVIDAPLSASSINSRYGGSGYGHTLELPGPGFLVGVDPTATVQGVGGTVVIHF